ncbi:MAG TPA: DUF1573 domain-containing protein [Terriglobales bacterium]|nr:DUF1573 domain-containing protein [Terriglobales bacterium]
MLSFAANAQAPRATLVEPNFQFGKAAMGSTVEHAYVVRNTGSAPLRLTNVTMTPPLRPVKLQATIAPGQEAQLKFALDTEQVSKEFDGQIVLSTDDPKTPHLEMRFSGEVVPSLEISPKPVVVLVGQRGHSTRSELELVNHEPDPVQITGIEFPRERVDVRSKAIEQGRRYRLDFTLDSSAALGRNENFVVVHTTSQLTPEVRIALFTYVRERVYTFPDSVDLGQLSLKEIRADRQFTEKAAQTLMVYQLAGNQFHINIHTDIPGLHLTSDPGPKGDRYQITATLSPDITQPGPIQGEIVIETNDKEFPRLVVPVTGRVIP